MLGNAQADDGLLRQPKRFALLVYLAVAGDSYGVHSRDLLQAMFWPELDQARARNALAQALHFLRQLLPAGALVAHGRTTLRVDQNLVYCDAADLKRAAAEGRARDVIDRYTGDLLPGFFLEDTPEFERWLEDERMQLARVASSAATEHAELSAKDGNLPEAIRWARRALEIAPDDEPAFRRLLSLLDRAGDRAGAAALETSFRQRLASEYGLEPSAETEALTHSIRVRRLARAPGTAAAPRSVAVLPFSDMGADQTDSHLADGLSEELIAILAGIPGLHVVSRTSAFAYRDSALPLRQIASELGVETIVEGSIRRVGERARITAQLIDARTDAHMWAESYDRSLTDIFAVERDVALRIVDALRSRFTPEQEQRAASRATHHPDAYHHYLEARHLCVRGSAASWQEGIAAFHRALAVDPRYASALAGLADAYMQPALFSLNPPVSRREARQQARTAALQALHFAPELAEAHATLGVVQWYDWDWAAAEASLRKAIALQPGHAESHQRMGLLLTYRGHFDEAKAALQRAQELDPLSLAIFTSRGLLLLRARKYEEAIAHLGRALEIDPHAHAAMHFLTEAYVYAERFDDWVAAAQRRVDLSPDDRHMLRTSYDEGGVRAMRQATIRMLEKAGGSPAIRACLHARLDELDRAFELLYQAFDERDPLLADGVRVHPGFDPMRGDRRFNDILERMNIPLTEAIDVSGLADR